MKIRRFHPLKTLTTTYSGISSNGETIIYIQKCEWNELIFVALIIMHHSDNNILQIQTELGPVGNFNGDLHT